MTGFGGISRRALLVTGGLAFTTGMVKACSASSNTSSAHPWTTGAPIPGAGAALPRSAPPVAPPPDTASIKANELGLVPVMMYHRITEKVRGEFDTTPTDFRRQLQRMFAAGYRPVRTIDLVRGQFHVAAGYTPVVLTFDDGCEDQFRVSPSGEIDPQSGMGILLEVSKEFYDCSPAGSFNINKNPFGLKDPAHQRLGLQRLHESGFEIANHTFNHDNLSRLDATGVQKDFVQLQQLVQRAVPGASVLTTALPFGIAPHNRALAVTGNWGNLRYTNEGVLLVGANPSRSPFSAKFTPQAIPRIRCTSWHQGNVPMTANYWLDYFDAHKSSRYISAGNPGQVTVPTSLAARVAPRWKAHLITY